MPSAGATTSWGTAANTHTKKRDVGSGRGRVHCCRRDNGAGYSTGQNLFIGPRRWADAEGVKQHLQLEQVQHELLLLVPLQTLRQWMNVSMEHLLCSTNGVKRLRHSFIPSIIIFLEAKKLQRLSSSVAWVVKPPKDGGALRVAFPMFGFVFLPTQNVFIVCLDSTQSTCFGCCVFNFTSPTGGTWLNIHFRRIEWMKKKIRLIDSSDKSRSTEMPMTAADNTLWRTFFRQPKLFHSFDSFKKIGFNFFLKKRNTTPWASRNVPITSDFYYEKKIEKRMDEIIKLRWQSGGTGNPLFLAAAKSDGYRQIPISLPLRRSMRWGPVALLIC